jgi:Cyanobacterial TRADD-N associated 2-Transmembrane domain
MDAVKLLEPLSAVIAGLAVLVTLFAAFRSGAIRRLVIGPVTLERGEEVDQARALIAAVQHQPAEPIPYETEQLARYYGQVLAQSKMSFWFSLVFASLGFMVIIAAALLYSAERQGTTVASFLAGVVIDSVAGLFFVQSKEAQRSMGEFFDKLRKDRQQADSRALCESIEDSQLKDALRLQLALYYAGVDGHQAVAGTILAGHVHTPEVGAGQPARAPDV